MTCTDCTPSRCPNGKCRATNQCIDQMNLPLTSYERQGSGYDSGACGYELQGRAAAPSRTIIAFTGLAGSGKSTAAKHLFTRHGFERVRFAGPLKEMLRAFYVACGVSERDAERRIEGDWKETADPLLAGRTPRYSMQTLGTEWGRNLIGDEFWISAWRAAVDALPPNVPVVVDDCRFPNEAAAIRAVGGMLVHVVRPGAGSGAAGHSSEGQDLGPVVATLRNTGTVAAFLTTLDYEMRDLSWVGSTH